MMAMITGLTPYSTHCAAGRVPYRTYAHANARTISIAGRMNRAPASTSASGPART